jgi:hypothetical protein
MADEGLIETSDVDKLSVAEAAALHPWAPLICAGLIESLPSMIAEEEVKTSGAPSSKLTFDK